MHLGKLKCRAETIHRLMFVRIAVHEVKKVRERSPSDDLYTLR